METACVIAFFGFLRCGEFTVLQSFDPDSNVCNENVTINDDHELHFISNHQKQIISVCIYPTVSSTYANILKYHIQGMPTNIIVQVFI